MDALDVTSLERCLEMLQRAYAGLQKTEPGSFEYDVLRSACVKEFELVLEVVVKLLRRVLREYVTTTRELAEMTFKEVLRVAARHNLIGLDEVDKWFMYRNIRNSTAHEYGNNLAEKLVTLLPEFIQNGQAALAIFRRHN